MPLPQDRPRRVVGCMTGTSLDGIDLALVEFDGIGRELSARTINHFHASLGELHDPLRRARDEILTVAEVARLSRDLGVLHADTIRRAWPALTPDLVAAHGQTLFHQPPLSVQLLNPWPIAATLGCPVVSDLRGADLAAGGEGAPITPLADQVLYRDHIGSGDLVIVNLGGFANATILAKTPNTHPRGFDCCPCNHLLDAAARNLLGQPFDCNGDVALGGTPDDLQAQKLAKQISQLNVEERSGGTGDEGIDLAISESTGLDQANHLATIADAIARAIVKSLEDAPTQSSLCLAGGGARNAALRRAIQHHWDGEVVLSDQLGVPIEAREAAAMAVLGIMAADGVPITNTQTTAHTSTPPRAGLWVLPHEMNEA